MFLLSRKRVLVSVGSSGIGLATAQIASLEGAAVTVASRSRSKLDSAAQAIGSGAVASELDTGDDEAVVRFFSDHEPFDHIIVSAAQTASGPVRGFPLDEARRAMESKFWGAYRVARAARGSMRAVRSPSCRLSSACALSPGPCSKARSTRPWKRWRAVLLSNSRRCGSPGKRAFYRSSRWNASRDKRDRP